MLLEETKKQRAESERISADIIAIVPSKATLEREMALAKEEAEKARAEAERRKFALLAAFKDVQSAQETMEASTAEAHRYRDPSYWEERHSEAGLDDATFDWYNAYPEEALRELKSRRKR